MIPSSTVRISGAEPFFLPGNRTGIVLIHGYGGSIGDYRECAERLQSYGYTVSGICLAGHGQGLAVLRHTAIATMLGSLQSAILHLQNSTDRIFLVGSSFGATLALAVAEEATSSLAGVIVVNPALSYRGGGIFQGIALRLLRLFTPYYAKRGLTAAERLHAEQIGSSSAWPIDGILSTTAFAQQVVIPKLWNIHQPVLILESTKDKVVVSEKNTIVFTSISSKMKQRQTIPFATHRPFRDTAAVTFIAHHIHDFITAAVVEHG